MVPGLYLTPLGGAFSYVSASFQGLRTNEILWLVDGVRISSRLYNSVTPIDTLPAHMVGRIEVLEGGQGLFYGTMAVGGVINVVTYSARWPAAATRSPISPAASFSIDAGGTA